MNIEVSQYVKITPDKAKKLMDSEAVVVLDVRTDEEYKEKHIPGAVLIPDYDIKSSAPKALIRKDAKILVYCRSGKRSEAASKKLIEMGYANVYDFGGIMDWPFETAKGQAGAPANRSGY